MTSCRLVSCVVPCFNEAASLPELHRQLSAACRAAPIADYEIILVNDGSPDNTWSVIQSLCEADPHVVGVDLSRNHGHQLALSAGLALVSGDLVFVLDADLQDPPELLSAMIATMESEQADVVYGLRISRAGETLLKSATAALFYRLLKRLANAEIPLDTGDFRIMRRHVVDVLNAMPETHRFIRGMVSWIGYRQVPFGYSRNRRHAGVTNYPLRKMIAFAADAITGFSISPLRFSVVIGLVTAGLALLLIGYTLFSYLFRDAVPGWASIMGATLLLGSAQMVMLGIIGEYLGRLFMQSKNRPLYVVREVRRAAVPSVPDRSADRAP